MNAGQVFVVRESRYCSVRFNYDPATVALVKDCVPREFRRWNPDLRQWEVDPHHIDGLVAKLKAKGARVSERRAAPPPPPPRDDYARAREEARRKAEESARAWEQLKRDLGNEFGRFRTAPGDWAETMLRAVGPARIEAVYKALSRVLHPDMPTGDTVLMQQLNSAREKTRHP